MALVLHIDECEGGVRPIGVFLWSCDGGEVRPDDWKCVDIEDAWGKALASAAAIRVRGIEETWRVAAFADRAEIARLYQLGASEESVEFFDELKALASLSGISTTSLTTHVFRLGSDLSREDISAWAKDCDAWRFLQPSLKRSPSHGS